MFAKSEIIQIAKEQLALECNCLPGDFDKAENIVTEPVCKHPPFLRMTTMGGNAVICADKCMHAWLSDFCRQKAGHRLFEHTGLREIDKVLSHYGKQLSQTHHLFLPVGRIESPPAQIQVKWFEADEIAQFYGTNQYPNAFCSQYEPERPDVLAVAAVNGSEIIGMAGCSADSSFLWQIGIDVMDGYRGRRVGTQLVALLRDEVMARGKIPYYGASLSNIYSWRIALRCGFVPAWIDITA